MTAGAGIPVAALAAIALAVAVGGTLSGLVVAFVVDVVRRRRQRKADLRAEQAAFMARSREQARLARTVEAAQRNPAGVPVTVNFEGRVKLPARLEEMDS